LGALPVLAWAAARKHPHYSWKQCAGLALLTMAAMLGSEWCHNLAHAAVAQAIGKPVDAIRIVWGMPLLVYYDINDRSVKPRQHLLRALGGPVFNALTLPVLLLLKRFSAPGSPWRDLVEVALKTNVFLLTVGLLPIPGIDGGAVLKWSLVEQGQTIAHADRTVQKVNAGLGLGLAAGSLAALKKKRRFISGFLGLLSVTAFAVASGFFKEQK